MKKILLLVVLFCSSNVFGQETFYPYSLDWSMESHATVQLLENGVSKFYFSAPVSNMRYPSSGFGHTTGYVPFPNYNTFNKSYVNEDGTHYVNAGASPFVFSTPGSSFDVSATIIAGLICSVGHTIADGAPPMIQTSAMAAPKANIYRSYFFNSNKYRVKAVMRVAGTFNPEVPDSQVSWLTSEIGESVIQPSKVRASFSTSPTPRWQIDFTTKSSTGVVTESTHYVDGLSLDKTYVTYEVFNNSTIFNVESRIYMSLNENGISNGYSGSDPSSDIEFSGQSSLEVVEVIDLE